MINERAAQRFFAGLNPIGQRIRVSAQLARRARNGPKTVVGVVGNVKYGSLDEETPAEIYLPYDQQPVDATLMNIRFRAGWFLEIFNKTGVPFALMIRFRPR